MFLDVFLFIDDFKIGKGCWGPLVISDLYSLTHLWKNKPVTLNKINTSFNFYVFPSSQIIRDMFLLTKLTTKNSKCSMELMPFPYFLLFINFLKKYSCLMKHMLVHTCVSLSISKCFSILAFPFLLWGVKVLIKVCLGLRYSNFTLNDTSCSSI